jgi:hypothetical protein
VCTAADRLRRAGTLAPADAGAASLFAPVTADTWRQSAASDDSERGAERHLAMASDTTRHAGLGLQNGRVQVRFLSHLPASPEFMGGASPVTPAHCVCFDPYLTQLHTTRIITADLAVRPSW